MRLNSYLPAGTHIDNPQHVEVANPVTKCLVSRERYVLPKLEFDASTISQDPDTLPKFRCHLRTWIDVDCGTSLSPLPSSPSKLRYRRFPILYRLDNAKFLCEQNVPQSFAEQTPSLVASLRISRLLSIFYKPLLHFYDGKPLRLIND